MFGKGVYFADVASKSVNYCRAHQSGGIGLMILCKVALGTPNPLWQSNYNAADLPAGTHSTKGCGRNIPDEKGTITYDDCKLAAGKII